MKQTAWRIVTALTVFTLTAPAHATDSKLFDSTVSWTESAKLWPLTTELSSQFLVTFSVAPLNHGIRLLISKNPEGSIQTAYEFKINVTESGNQTGAMIAFRNEGQINRRACTIPSDKPLWLSYHNGRFLIGYDVPGTNLIFDWTDTTPLITADSKIAFVKQTTDAITLSNVQLAAPTFDPIKLKQSISQEGMVPTLPTTLPYTLTCTSRSPAPFSLTWGADIQDRVMIKPASIDAEQSLWCIVEKKAGSDSVKHIIIGTGTPRTNQLIDRDLTTLPTMLTVLDAGPSNPVTFSAITIAGEQTQQAPTSEPTPTSYTNTPKLNTYEWPEFLKTETPDNFIVFGGMQNVTTNGGDGKAHTVIGFKIKTSVATDPKPAFRVDLQYNGTNFTIALLKGDFGISGMQSIMETTNKAAWDALMAWQQGTEKSFALLYRSGSFLFMIDGVEIWFYTDTGLGTGVDRVCLASTGNQQAYHNVSIATGSMALQLEPQGYALIANNGEHITFNTAQAVTELESVIALSATARYTLSLAGKKLTLSHRDTATNSSIIPTSTGSFTIGVDVDLTQPQQWWLSFDKGNIALGTGQTPGTNSLIAWQAPQQILTARWLSVQTTPLATAVQEVTPTLNWQTLTSTPAKLGLTATDKAITTYGLNGALAYTSATNQAWSKNWELSKPDDGMIEFDLTLTDKDKAKGNGVTIFFSTTATGVARYSVSLEPDTASFGARISAAAYANGTATPVGSIALVSGHVLDGRYRVSYSKGTITVVKVASDSTIPLATIVLPNPQTGIVWATVASMYPTKVANVVTTAATAATQNQPGSVPNGPSSNSLTTVTRTGEPEYPWSATALQYSLSNALNGFVCKTDFVIAPGPGQTSAWLAIGFSPEKIDLTRKARFDFGDGSGIQSHLAGATHNLILVGNGAKTTIVLYKGDNAEGSASAPIKSVTVDKNILDTKHSLWISYRLTDQYAILSLGIDSDPEVNPLWTLSDIVPSKTDEYLKKVGLSSWGCGVTYDAIMFSALPDKAATTQQSTTTAAPSGLLTLPFTAESPLAFEWNRITPALGAGGGMLRTLAQVNALSAGYATLVFGLSKDPASDVTIPVSGQPFFKGADIIIVLQVSASTAYVYARTADSTSESDYKGFITQSALSVLVTPDATGAYPNKMLYLSVDQYGQTSRVYKLWMADAENSSIESTTPLWSWEETLTDKNAPLSAVGVCGWSTGVTFTAPVLTPKEAQAAPVTEVVATKPAGTLTEAGQPVATQWNDATNVKKLLYNSIVSFTAQASNPDDKVVLGFRKEGSSNTTSDFIFTFSPQGFSKSGPDGYQASTLPNAKLTPEGGKFWISFKKQEGAQSECIAVGTYVKASDDIDSESYIEYLLPANDTSTREFTYGTSATAKYAYLTGSRISPDASTISGTLMRPVLRSGQRGKKSLRAVSATPVSQAEGQTTTATPKTPVSDAMSSRLYRTNTTRTAR